VNANPDVERFMKKLDPPLKAEPLADKTGLLVGDGDTVRFANFANITEVKQNQKSLTQIIKHWIKLQDRRK